MARRFPGCYHSELGWPYLISYLFHREDGHTHLRFDHPLPTFVKQLLIGKDGILTKILPYDKIFSLINKRIFPVRLSMVVQGPDPTSLGVNNLNKEKIYMEHLEHYEVFFIVPGAMKDEEALETIGKVKKLLEDLEGKITKEDNWGRKSLAYPIKHETQGTYGLFEFDLDPKQLQELNKRMRLSREILRYLVVKAKIKTAADLAEEEKIKEKIASKKKEAMKEKIEVAEKEKKEDAEIKTKKAVTQEKIEKSASPKPSTEKKEKVSMEDLDKKLDELLSEDLD